MSYPGTVPVREAHRFDEMALEAYLGDHVDGFSGPLEVVQFEGGQSNPTFLLLAGGDRYVLRKKPPGKLLPSAHQVDREYRIMKALEPTDVPVPHMFVLCEDAGVIGTEFYVMEHMEGRVFRDPKMPDCTPDERSAIIDSMNDVLAKLHNVDIDAVGLGDLGKRGEYIERQIARWTKQYEAAKTDKVEAMERLMEWLPEHIPGPDETTIAHGDYRLENSIVHPTEPRLIAVLDWELTTLGHPLADLAYNCMLYHFPANPQAGASNGYGDLDLKEWGIPSEEEYVARYCERTGRDGIPDYDFYLAFAMFRLAAIAQGVYKRGLDGNASSQKALSYGKTCQFLAETAWDIARR
ncbi:MAG: phosphotransferase [Chromatiales bacterium]|jgi:aminoglycoside phosphotransferase (APT) family kinase protein